ncbi:hypothetical protein QFZ22_009799 [Streptomyces canus]|uniref:SpdB n=1 Tax=Streptomyces canus TaxID=58343 RepID=A0AAW8FU86_9ACTN|nr:hypothetical protein [Streptomyces canus]MDQ0913727.1 hypothetical protein [Streptomyces canus]
MRRQSQSTALAGAGGMEPAALRRLRTEIRAADRTITSGTWVIAAGMVLWSMLNATPYVRAHITPGWENTAWVLPLVTDVAFVIALRADEIASRHGAKAGVWPVLLRLFTGGASVFLNIGHSWESDDATGVAQHLVAPMLLVLAAEAGPAYRRGLAARLAEAEGEAEKKAAQARREAEREEQQRRLQEQADADREAQKAREEADRLRAQAWEDERRRLELEDQREEARAKRALEARRLDIEEKRLTTSAPGPQPRPAVTAPALNGHAPAAPVRVPVAPVASAPRTGIPAPQARTGADNGPAVGSTADPRTATADSPTPVRQDATASVAATQTARARVTARIEEHQEAKPETAVPAHSKILERPTPAPVGPVKDWDLPGLPADCAPGRAPELLTDAQVTARIDYGLTQEWTQRRIGEFAGRSATVVNRRKKEREKAA